jgi:hypothetical protein
MQSLVWKHSFTLVAYPPHWLTLGQKTTEVGWEGCPDRYPMILKDLIDFSRLSNQKPALVMEGTHAVEWIEVGKGHKAEYLGITLTGKLNVPSTALILLDFLPKLITRM